jgi:subtilisin family serine protease
MIGSSLAGALPSLPLPRLVYAQVSARSIGGSSLFDARGPITAGTVNDFVSESGLVGTVVSQLGAAGFRVLQRSPLTINIAAPPALFETFFQTRLVTEERAVLRSADGDEETATFITTQGGGMAGLIDTSSSPLAGLLEGVAIEEPVLPFSDATTPPVVDYWHLDVPAGVAAQLHADGLHATDVTGAGVRLTMVDTGWYRHPYFTHRNYQSKVVLGPGTSDPDNDDSGHGTGESANAFAVAPAIDFTMVKMDFDNCAGAFNAAVDQSPAPDIISCSWGDDVKQGPLSAARKVLEAAVALAVANGIIVVFAAGNGQFGFPGQHPDMLTVGGVFIGQDGSMKAADYASGYASRIYPDRGVPDVSGLCGMRPGARYLMLPVQPGCDEDRSNAAAGDGTEPDDGWAAFSGTSAAAPQIAGVCALMKQVNPALTPAEARDVLARTARDITEGNAHPRTGSQHAGSLRDLATGYGLVDAQAAVAAVTPTAHQ